MEKNAVETLEKDGVVVLENVYSAEMLEKLRECFNKEWEEIYPNLDRVEWKTVQFKETQTPTFFLDNQLYQQKKFADYKGQMLIDMDYGRYDFCSWAPIDIAMTEPIYAIVNHFLQKNWSGYLGGLPVIGNVPVPQDGYWHRDMNSLFEDEAIDITLPPIYLTMIIPLDDIAVGEGTTEFLLGSHRMNFNKAGITSNAKLQEWVKTQPLLNQAMKAGSVCIFNGLTLHRGTKNLSGRCRNAFYIVFRKNWFSDDDAKNYILQ